MGRGQAFIKEATTTQLQPTAEKRRAWPRCIQPSDGEEKPEIQILT